VIKNIIILLSLALTCAVLIFCNVHWSVLDNRNLYLELRSQKAHKDLFNESKRCKQLRYDRQMLANSLWVLSEGRKKIKFRNSLKKLMRKRNKQSGLEFSNGQQKNNKSKLQNNTKK